jgi:alginate O-acetyltransferase complex protein AlgI
MLAAHQPAAAGWDTVVPAIQAMRWEHFDRQFWGLLTLGGAFAFMNAVPAIEHRALSLYAAHTLTAQRSFAIGLAAALLLLLSAGSIVGSSFNPFIYFRF